MDDTKIRFEIEGDAFPGLTIGFSASVPFVEDRHPVSFASSAALHAFASNVAKAAAKAQTTLSRFRGDEPNTTRIVSVSAEGDSHSFRRFSVLMPDGTTVQADALDFSDASLVAAAKFAFEGRSFSHLLLGQDNIASILDEIRAENAQGPVAEGKHCAFELSDWRVAEGEAGDLTPGQAEPFAFSVASGGYGPIALLQKDGETYSVAMEIDEGCLAVHVQGPFSDSTIATIRVARDAMQADLSSADGRSHESFLVGEGIERTPIGEKLTQDGSAVTAPSA